MRLLLEKKVQYLYRVRMELGDLPPASVRGCAYTTDAVIFSFRTGFGGSVRLRSQYKDQFLYRIRQSILGMPLISDFGSYRTSEIVVYIFRTGLPQNQRIRSEFKAQFLIRIRDSIKGMGPEPIDPGSLSQQLFPRTSDIGTFSETDTELDPEQKGKIMLIGHGLILQDMIIGVDISLRELISAQDSKITALEECCGSVNESLVVINEAIQNIEYIDSFDSERIDAGLTANRGKILYDLLTKLMPNVPTGISSISFWNINGVSGHMITGSRNVNHIIRKSSIGSKTITGIFDGEQGDLTFKVFSGSTEVYATSVAITDAPINSGVLQLTEPYDPFLGQQGQQGFYKKINSLISPPTTFYEFVSGQSNPYHFQLLHTSPNENNTGEVFEIDELNGTPNILSFSITNVSSDRVYVSGIPVLGAGTKIDFSANASNLVSNFFNNSWIMNCSGSLVNSKTFNDSNFGTIDTYGQQVSIANDVSISSNKFFIGVISLTVSGRNVFNESGNMGASTVNSYIIDSKSSDLSRVQSDDGDFPNIYPVGDCGNIYAPAQSLLENKELMILNAVVQYPSGDYTGYSGPDYSGISGYRWITKKVSSITGTKVNINFSGSSGFGSSGVYPSNFKLFIKCGEETPWIDGTIPFILGSSPFNNDGDFGYLIGESTPTLKVITFGEVISVPVDLYVRIGFDENCAVTFSNFTINVE